MTVYKRQRLLLAMVHAAGGKLSATDLQKLLFMYTRDWEDSPSYDFVPYKYGCFSFQSYADRHTLTRHELLAPLEKGEWQTTDAADAFLDPVTVNRCERFLTKAVPERGDELVAKVYRVDPFFASRSQIIDRIFPDGPERDAVERAKSISNESTVFTLGYEGLSIDAYLTRLLRNGVQQLCDVRRNPLSRKTGFSKNQLASYCSKVGIGYAHMPELGISGDRRRELKTRADYEQLFSEYKAEDLPTADAALSSLEEQVDAHGRVALTCFEKDPTLCHRHCVSDELSSRRSRSPKTVHL